MSTSIIAQNAVVGFADQKTKTTPKGVAISLFPQENIWFALRATKEKIARKGDNFPKNRFLVDYYSQVRTYFERNG